MPCKLVMIKKRPDFVHATTCGYKDVRFGLLLQVVKTPRVSEPNVCRVGYTASKRIGNAVFRNRAKRRLRSLCSVLLPRFGLEGYDYVLIARKSTVEREYKELYVDFKRALKRIKRKIDEETTDNANATETRE